MEQRNHGQKRHSLWLLPVAATLALLSAPWAHAVSKPVTTAATFTGSTDGTSQQAVATSSTCTAAAFDAGVVAAQVKSCSAALSFPRYGCLDTRKKTAAVLEFAVVGGSFVGIPGQVVYSGVHYVFQGQAVALVNGSVQLLVASAHGTLTCGQQPPPGQFAGVVKYLV